MTTKFKRIGIISKFSDTSIGTTIEILATFLTERHHQVVLEESAAKALPGTTMETSSIEQLGVRCDLVIVVGGDGTLLHAARSLVEHNIPLVGINLGRLGFLTDISPDDMLSRLNEILDGTYYEEKRFLLRALVVRNGETVQEGSAFNDVVIHKWNSVRMIEFETHVDGLLVNSQRSDGLIVSTPTGSTAYALSGGGPILHPALNAIVLVPICPHTLSNRPIVIDGNSVIELRVTHSDLTHVRLTLDGQNNFGLEAGDIVKIMKKEKPVRLFHPKGHDHFQILRAKLRWG
ncbi:MAG: NAD(+) kinase [Pseudomonadota bacterium]|nr:NAD(+) kinase [Pseudomonadota bacterium]